MKAGTWFAMTAGFLSTEGITLDDIINPPTEEERWHEVDKRQVEMWKERLDEAQTEEERQKCLNNINSYQESIDAYLAQQDNTGD